MAKPNLALIPAAQGTKLYSVLPSDGSGDFDYTRGSSATRINAQGLIESVANTSSRLNYPLLDGKVVGCPHHLLEPQRTNLLQYSEDFSQSYWTKTNITITSNNTISPDGSLNATKLNEATVSNANFRLRASGVATTGTNTLSIFAKASERNWVMLRENAQTGVYAFFDLKNGTVGQNTADDAVIEYYGNGWYKLSITDVLTSVAIDVRIAIADGVDSYNGVIGNGVYVYGFQIEAGSYPTSYIKSNSGSATTRLAETASGSGSAATFNDSEGVFMAEISALANDGTFRVFGLSNGSTSNRIVFYYSSTTNNIQLLITAGGVVQSELSIIVNDVKTFKKIAIKYKLNDVALWVNGFELKTDTSATMPSGLNELAFDDAIGGDKFYGNTKQLQYFDTTDIDLEELTSWDSFSDMANGQLYTIE